MSINKENLQQLITTISNPKNDFKWSSPASCLGFYCNKLLGLTDFSRNQSDAISKFLNLPLEQARNLYFGRNVGSLHMRHSHWMPELYELDDSSEIQREKAVAYLTSLLEEK